MVAHSFTNVVKERPFTAEPHSYLPLQSLSTAKSGHHPAIIIHQPEPFDILCGKDKNFSSHPGNRCFRELIESMVEPYERAFTKQDKMRFTRNIVATLKTKYNSRFLRRIPNNASGSWQEISESMARDKVSHALRFAASHKGTEASRTSSTNNNLLPSVNIETEQVMSRSVDCVSSCAHVEKCDTASIPQTGDQVEVETLFQIQQAILEALRKDLPAHEPLTAVNVLTDYFVQKPEPIPDRRDNLLALLKEPLFEWSPDPSSSNYEVEL